MRSRTSISLGLLGAILLASVFATTWTFGGPANERRAAANYSPTDMQAYDSPGSADLPLREVEQSTPRLSTSTTVTVSSASILVGETATIWLRALKVSPPGLGAWTINIQYDAAVVSVAGCAPEHIAACNSAFQPNAVRIVGNAVPGQLGDVTLASIGFTCLSAGTSGLLIDVELLADATVGDPQPIAVSTSNSSISCKAGLLGDVTCDGIVDTIDVLSMLRFLAGLEALSCPANADSNQDLLVDSIDSALLLQFLAGLISSLPP